MCPTDAPHLLLSRQVAGQLLPWRAGVQPAQQVVHQGDSRNNLSAAHVKVPHCLRQQLCTSDGFTCRHPRTAAVAQHLTVDVTPAATAVAADLHLQMFAASCTALMRALLIVSRVRRIAQASCCSAPCWTALQPHPQCQLGPLLSSSTAARPCLLTCYQVKETFVLFVVDRTSPAQVSLLPASCFLPSILL